MPRLFYEQLFECNLQSSSRKKIKNLDINSWNWKLFLEVFKTYSDISARKSFVVNHAQSWNGNLNSIVFCSVMARTGINALVVRSKKSQKERSQMCFECKCRINNILGKKQWLSLPYSQCSLVIAHRCAEYESLRFDCSLELRIFFPTYARDMTQKHPCSWLYLTQHLNSGVCLKLADYQSKDIIRIYHRYESLYHPRR